MTTSDQIMLILLFVGVLVGFIAYLYAVQLIKRNNPETVIEYLKRQRKSKRSYSLYDFAKERYKSERNSTLVFLCMMIFVFIYWFYGTIKLLIEYSKSSSLSGNAFIVQVTLGAVMLVFFLFVNIKIRIFKVFSRYLKTHDD